MQELSTVRGSEMEQVDCVEKAAPSSNSQSRQLS